MAGPVVNALSAIDVLDAEGRTVRLGSLWDGRPVLLAMIRHFG
jgi:hypothetical protein